MHASLVSNRFDTVTKKQSATEPGSMPLSWALLFVAAALLLGYTLIGFYSGSRGWPDLLLVGAIAVLAASAVRSARGWRDLLARRQSEAETFSRLAQALSRSLSPTAVIEAIVRELGTATSADHVAVVQVRPGGHGLEVNLVSMAAGQPSTTSVMPIGQLEPIATNRLSTVPRAGGNLSLASANRGSAGDQARRASFDRRSRSLRSHRRSGMLRWIPRRLAEADLGPAEEQDEARDVAWQIASRLRDAYGLRNTMAAPLVEDDAILGAIVLSRRGNDAWTPASVKLLWQAAGETTAALSRVYTYQAAAQEARTDQLTRLANRRFFDEYCTLVASRRRSSDMVAMLAVDVDHFKRLNDMYGHQTGDVVLRSIASAIQTSVREDDLPARYGGEEFVVLLRNPGPGVALEVGERIRRSVREMDLSEVGVTDRVTVSVGVASSQSASEPISDIVERADRALYAAKRAGCDRVVESWAAEVS